MDQGQGAKTVGVANAVIKDYDFSDFKSICDIGGGQGDFLIHLLANYPDTMGCVADVPGAILSAERVIANANLSDRCKVIPYDFHKEEPPICDVYFLVNVLHDWNDEVCIQILKNIAGSMNTNSKLWIVEYIIEPEPGFSVAKLLDLEVLVMGGGCERTIDAYEVLLNAVGLELSKTIPLKTGPTMMECLLE